MKLIVGLGNPGNKYRNNRHNVGFQFLDYMAQKLQVLSIEYRVSSIKPLNFDRRLHSEIAEIKIEDQTIILAKPQTFMNESGKAVLRLVTRYSLLVTSNLYVVHDDLDLRLGTYKIQKGVGPRLHNGIESIENHLKTKDFWRVRIGVDNRDPDRRIPGEVYVLQNFTEEELHIIREVFNKIDIFSKFQIPNPKSQTNFNN